MKRNEVLILIAGLMFGLGAGFMIGYTTAINKAAEIAIQIFRESGVQVDSNILNQMIQYGFGRMGL